MQCSPQNAEVRKIGLVTLLLLLAVLAAAQRPFSRAYPLNESGSPVRINALIQDAQGYIWAGGDDGLYCYNGENFVRLKDTLQAPVTALCASGSTVWAGYKNGRIKRVESNHLTAVPVDAQPTAAITSLYPAGNGVLLISTEDGLYFITGGHAIPFTPKDGLPNGFLYSVLPLSPGAALLASDNGLTELSYNAGRLSIAAKRPSAGLPDPILRVMKPIPGTSRYWLGTQQGGLALYDRDKHPVTAPPCNTPWRWGQVNDILVVSAKQAWAATEEGHLLELTLDDAVRLTITPRYSTDKSLSKLLLDKTGNLWCATNEGLLKLTVEYANYIPLAAPYSLSNVTAINCDKSSTLFLAQDDQLYSLSLKDSLPRMRFIYKAPVSISSLFTDRQGRLWIGTLGNGLWYKEAGSDKIIRSDIDALKDENVLSIAGTEGCLWVAGLTGVREVSFPDGQGRQELKKRHTKASGIGTDYVYQIYPDRHDRIWMATDGAGVSMYETPKYHNWNQQSGMGSKVAYSITEDAAGDMWAATLEKGLYRYTAGKWLGIGAEQGLQDMNVSALSATASGLVVAVNNHGIDEWYPGSHQFRHYNRRLGLDIDSTSKVLNCIAKDAEGNVYVPFEDGIMILKNEGAAFDIRPAVHIAHAGLFMNPVTPGRHSFQHDENYLSFYFDGLNFTNPERLGYRYMLEGYNNQWIGTNDESVTFPNLPPGKYNLRVQASMSEDFSGAGEAAYAFEIAPPFWRRAWFILLALVLSAGVIYLLIKRRDVRMNNLLQLKQERITFEYEHLKSQVNPHFLFNSLNTLTGLIEEGNVPVAAFYTEQLSDLYRNMLAYRDRDLILLAEEWALLSSYLHIQQSRFEQALQVKVDIPEPVLRSGMIVPMALQLLVENAIKHNVVSKSSPLLIHITAIDGEITISNNLAPKLKQEKGAGLGLENIRRRYEGLTKKKITYGIRAGQYIVTLPLL